MSDWLKNSLTFFRTNFNNIETLNYRIFIFIVYNDYSNRNLAKLVSELFDKNEIDIYFEIDEIIVNSNFPKDELDETIRLFKKNNYYEWVENK